MVEFTLPWLLLPTSMVQFTFGWSRFHTRSRFHSGVGSGSGSFVQIAIPIPESEISGIITALIGTILPNLKMFLLYQTRHKGLRKINGFICLWDEFLFSLHLRGGFWFFRHQIFAFWCSLFKWFFWQNVLKLNFSDVLCKGHSRAEVLHLQRWPKRLILCLDRLPPRRYLASGFTQPKHVY